MIGFTIGCIGVSDMKHGTIKNTQPFSESLDRYCEKCNKWHHIVKPSYWRSAYDVEACPECKLPWRCEIVGTFTLSEKKTFTNNFECPAWYENIACQPGEYEVRRYFTQPNTLYVSIPGKIESDYFQSLWCGSIIGDRYNTKKNAGKDAMATVSFYSYSVKKDDRFKFTKEL